MKLKHILFCFWILWSQTKVSSEFGVRYIQGGLILDPAAADPYNVTAKTKPGKYWRKTGGYYDTKAECEKVVDDPVYVLQQLVCLPNGVKPKP